MKTVNNIKRGSRLARFSHTLGFKFIITSALIATFAQAPLQAQEAKKDSVVKYTEPKWWFGVAAGANFNFYRGTTQELNLDLTAPAAFHHGFGVGLFVAPLLEYHHPDSKWGIMLQAGYDSRKGKFEQEFTPCNCPADLSTKLNYLTIEPSFRFEPFDGNLYLFAGPRFAYNLNSEFTYKQGINPAYPDQVAPADVTDDFSAMEAWRVSMQIGAGYDIPMMTENKRNNLVFSPFVSFHPYFGQAPRAIETWNVSTLRIGAALKFGRGKEIVEPAEEPVAALSVIFRVVSPENIPVERRVRETFPIRNYVFFDLGSTQIPDRYVLINKEQVPEFNESRLEVFTPKTVSGRSGREMVAYYNLLNILGDRMNRNPEAIVRLSGASMQGIEDGLAMAETVKKYLVDVFSIAPARINTEGRIKPRIPSEQPGGTLELEMLRQGDRRVSIWSESPALSLEFQTGPNTPLKPVEIVGVQTAPLDSYVTFSVVREKEPYASWSLEIADAEGVVQNYGPYTEEKVSLPGKSVLGTRPQGNYNVTMVGTTNIGTTEKRDTTVSMVLWTPDTNEMGMRFSILYEFNASEAIAVYDKYLTEIVTPKIPKNGKVIIHGYTDIIGDSENNKALSTARANDVRAIIEASLAKAGRKDVRFEVYGFGEDENLSPFENKYPEERFYNRSVIIDIIPAK